MRHVSDFTGTPEKTNPSGRVPLTERALKHAEAFSPMAEREIQEKGYLAPALVQCGMPLTKPTETSIVRKNGNMRVIYTSGIDKDGKPIGLPYGAMARYLMIYINSQAFEQKSRRIKITSHLYEFLRELDIPIVTGKRGSTTALRAQLNRLLRSQIAFVREDDTRDSFALMPISGEYDIWWNYRNPHQDSFFDSWVELGEKFYEAIVSRPVPILLDHIKQLRGSPLAIDFYVWVSYRLFLMGRKKGSVLRLPVPVLRDQLGSSFTRSRDFVPHMNEAIAKVRAVFPHLKCTLTVNGFTLEAGPTPLADMDKFAHVTGSQSRTQKSLAVLEKRELTHEIIDAGRALAPGFDMRHLERSYWEWVETSGQHPKYVKAHFLKFCKTHAAKNPI
jgi:hypothetical protein